MEYEAQDWAYQVLNEKTKKRQYSTLPGLTPAKKFMIPDDNPPTSSMLEKTLPKLPEIAVNRVMKAPLRPTSETAWPNMQKQSSSNGKVGQVESNYGTFLAPSVLPTPQTITRNSSKPAKSIFTESFVDSLAMYPPVQDSRYSEACLEGGKRSRAEHVNSIKKRDLTTETASHKMSKFHPIHIGDQCRKLLHDALSLPVCRNTNSDSLQLEFEHKNATANNGKHSEHEKRSSFRRTLTTPQDAAILQPYHIYMNSNVREPTTPANSVVSVDENVHYNAMNRIRDERHFSKANPTAALPQSHTRSLPRPNPSKDVTSARTTASYTNTRASTPLLQIATDRILAGQQPKLKALPRASTSSEINQMDTALWENGWTARSLPWRKLAEYCEIGEDNKERLPCTETIRAALNKRGWRSRKAARKPHNFLPIIKERLRYWEYFRHWSDADFKTVRYSDEKHWGAEPQRTVWVRRQPGAIERTAPENIQYDPPQVRQRKKIIRNDLPENDDDDAGKDLLRYHCWGAVGWNFKSKLVWYETTSKNGKMNKSIYVEKVLKDEILTWERPQEWVLEQDRDSGHGWFPKKHTIGVNN